MSGSGQTVTYRQLDEEANRLSHVLRDAGLEAGDHVAFCLENHPRFLSVMWGCHYAGLYYTAMSSRLTTEEMAYIAKDCGAKAFITSRYKAEQAAELVDQMPGVGLRLMLDGTIDGYEPYEAALDAASTEPLDGRVEATDMLYSSGTTGLPKGVKILRARCAARRGRLGDRAVPAAVRGDRRHGLPVARAALSRRSACASAARTHRLGGTVVVMERFDPEEYLAAVEQLDVTMSQVVPTMFIRMLKLPEEVRARYDVSSLAHRDPRCCSVSQGGEAGDDRLVGADHPRVLRRHRGQRLRLLQQPGLAGAQGHGRQVAGRHLAHPR